MKPKVYLETTIISYFAARPSRDIEVFISQIVLQEARAGDEDAIKRRLEMLESLPIIEVNPDAVSLAQALVSDGIIPQKAAADALHIAIATVQGMDYLLTWNVSYPPLTPVPNLRCGEADGLPASARIVAPLRHLTLSPPA
jgi:predicted nucleic acid-binding protein